MDMIGVDISKLESSPLPSWHYHSHGHHNINIIKVKVMLSCINLQNLLKEDKRGCLLFLLLAVDSLVPRSKLS